MNCVLFIYACILLVLAALCIKEGLDYNGTPMLVLGVFCAIGFICIAFALFSNSIDKGSRQCKIEQYTNVEDNTTTISIDHSGTYTIIGKDLDDNFIFVLEDKSGNRYVVNVERKDYHKFETGDKLTCAFIEKISRDSGETLECSNFEVFVTE